MVTELSCAKVKNGKPQRAPSTGERSKVLQTVPVEYRAGGKQIKVNLNVGHGKFPKAYC